MKIAVSDPIELKKKLILKGHSQISLAKLVDITPNYMNQIIAGDKFPSAKVAKRISEELEVEFEDIFFIQNSCKS